MIDRHRGPIAVPPSPASSSGRVTDPAWQPDPAWASLSPPTEPSAQSRQSVQSAQSTQPIRSPRPAPIQPSFLIRAAGGSAAQPAASTGSSIPLGQLRLDRVNSRQLLACARQIYFRHLSSGHGGCEPVGVVMVGETSQGRVVFDLPVLLPEERFVPIDLVRTRPLPRSRPGRPAMTRSGPAGSLP